MFFYNKKYDNRKCGRLRRLWRRFSLLFERFCNEKSWRIGEKLLVVMLALGLAMGGFAQIVRSSDSWSAKIYLGENWYGEKYETERVAADNDSDKVWGNVTLELMDYTTLPEVKVLLNGEQAGEFREQQLTVRVEYGDVIAVDATAYASPVRVRIKSVSSVIDTAGLQEISTVCSECREVGRIAFR